MTTLVLGMDIGGTSSRALIADLDGRVHGLGSGGGGNPTAHGIESAMRSIGEALAQALAGVSGVPVDPKALRANVIGAAGFSSRAARDALAEVWRGLDLPDAPTVVDDVAVAFASGTDADSGSVLVGGTGGVAATITDGRTTAIADGLGWLLGDRGSGFWIGRQAVLATLALGPDGDPLTAAVTAYFRVTPTGDSRAFRSAIVEAAYAVPPVRLAELARTVVATADAGSTTALRILEEAAGQLVSTLSEIRGAEDRSTIVLGGGLLSTSYLRSRVVAAVGQVWPGSPVRHTGSGVGGAAWLAARRTGSPLPPGLHAALTGA